MNQWIKNESANCDYPVWGTERKKSEEKWTDSKVPSGHHKAYHHVYNENLRNRRKNERGREKEVMPQTN